MVQRERQRRESVSKALQQFVRLSADGVDGVHATRVARRKSYSSGDDEQEETWLSDSNSDDGTGGTTETRNPTMLRPLDVYPLRVSHRLQHPNASWSCESP